MYNAINIFNTRFDKNRLIILVKEASFDYGDRCVIDSPEKAAAIVTDLFDADKLPEERLWLIALDGRRKISGAFEVSHGTLMASLVHPREIFSRAILCGAASIILAHNHPSGSLDISEQDREVTKRIRESGDLLGIRLDDHVIVAAGGDFVSAC